MARFRGSRRRRLRVVPVHKPSGEVAARVQAVGPEHFGILSIDGAKARSVMMLCDFYGKVIVEPTEYAHTQCDLASAVTRLQEALGRYELRDHIVAVERTGEYHRPVQRAFRAAGSDVRLVHPFATKQFRQPANPGIKTDATDLAAIHRAAANGFGLIDHALPSEYVQLQLAIRHRRDLVGKQAALCCQIRECLHAAMPGYASCFEDLWSSKIAILIARHTGSAAAVRQLGLRGLSQVVAQAGRRCRTTTLTKLLAWTDTAAPGHPETDWMRRMLANLDEDYAAKTRQIQALEQASAQLLVGTPYLLLLAIPGINIVSAADLAGEMGPITHYANANAITGRAGLVPSCYQSDRVDHANGPLIRAANRRLRTALVQIADNLVCCNHHYRARADRWYQNHKDPRWVRVKIAKSFSRLAYVLVAGGQLVRHPCLQQRHYLLDKLLAFHREHDTPVPQMMADVQAAIQGLPRSEYAAEARPLAEQLERIHAGRRGPQVLGNILPIVLARLGVHELQSPLRGDQDLS